MSDATGDGSSASSGPALRFTVAGQVEEVDAARQRVVELCASWGLGDLEDVAVVVSELVTNAIVHGRGDPELRVARVAGDTVRVEVADSSAAPPYLRNPYAQHTRGLGLHVVDALSQAWGHEAHGAGKLVWAHLVLDPLPGGDGLDVS